LEAIALSAANLRVLPNLSVEEKGNDLFKFTCFGIPMGLISSVILLLMIITS
jgi:hypothetical protein